MTLILVCPSELWNR